MMVVWACEVKVVLNTSVVLTERVVGGLVRATKFTKLSSSSRPNDSVFRRRFGDGVLCGLHLLPHLPAVAYGVAPQWMRLNGCALHIVCSVPVVSRWLPTATAMLSARYFHRQFFCVFLE